MTRVINHMAIVGAGVMGTGIARSPLRRVFG